MDPPAVAERLLVQDGLGVGVPEVEELLMVVEVTGLSFCSSTGMKSRYWPSRAMT